MSPLHVLAIQSTLSLVAFGFLARWHVAPRLSTMARGAALVPLLWVHVFRFAPLTLCAPGQVDPKLPADVAAIVAFGDLVAAIAALVAVLAIKGRVPGAIAWVWIFSIVGTGDLAYATEKAVAAQMYTVVE